MASFEIKQQAIAGTLESSDVQVAISPSNNGIEIDLQSNVVKQYGKQIRKVITNTLETMGVTDAKLTVVDKGALDCTIIARTVAAVHRANGISENYNWEEMDSWNA